MVIAATRRDCLSKELDHADNKFRCYTRLNARGLVNWLSLAPAVHVTEVEQKKNNRSRCGQLKQGPTVVMAMFPLQPW
jgi:hypothetical protein